MPSLKDIRGRIGSVRNIAQITRAMEMVAASRMKRAQDSILAARPYAEELEGALGRVASAAGLTEEVDPLLARRPVRRVAIVVVTTDRGLAGSLNANAIRSVLRWVAQRASAANDARPVEIDAITVGRKGRDALRRSGVPIAAHFPQLGDKPSFGDVTPIALVSPEMSEGHEESNDEYLFEPSPEAVLRRLLPHYVAIGIYRAVLENNASEQSARMIAMRNSTENANELVDDLTLVYNKTRQATITREMIEIASGAEALG
jgi:F-type H+-transporting ATPase subunit gamma